MQSFLFGLLRAVPVTVTGLLAEPCLSEEMRPQKGISEQAVRTISARLYSDILSQACLRGLLYSRKDIENGFKRHFEEMSLDLVGQGYTIVPDMIAHTPAAVLSQVGFDANRRRGLAGQFGCFRAYWLDE